MKYILISLSQRW